MLAIWSRLRRNPPTSDGQASLKGRSTTAAPRLVLSFHLAVRSPPRLPGATGLYVPPPLPPTFHRARPLLRQRADMAPTHEVAPREGGGEGDRCTSSARATPSDNPPRLRQMLQRLWMTIRRRRRRVVVGRKVLALVGGCLVIMSLPAPAPVATRNRRARRAPPAPTAAPQCGSRGVLRAELQVHGLRSALHPAGRCVRSLCHFSRPGYGMKWGVADARDYPGCRCTCAASSNASHRRHDEGQFPVTHVTTPRRPGTGRHGHVTNTRGETLSAALAFYWARARVRDEAGPSDDMRWVAFVKEDRRETGGRLWLIRTQLVLVLAPR